jgi:hypothetical protein
MSVSGSRLFETIAAIEGIQYCIYSFLDGVTMVDLGETSRMWQNDEKRKLVVEEHKEIWRIEEEEREDSQFWDTWNQQCADEAEFSYSWYK